MDWKKKNRIFSLIEKIPLGEEVYYFLQKHITKSIWVKDDDFIRYFGTKVQDHVLAIKKYGNQSMEKASFFEFGAGWDLITPIGLVFITGGLRYIAVDLNKYVQPELLINTVDLYYRNKKRIEEKYEIKLKDVRFADELQNVKIRQISEMLKKMGIEYYAPMDAGSTPFEDESIDYVISNVSLEHIPYKDIDRILNECNRLMKRDGIISMTVDYTDHWSHSDNKISIYNYLQFSDEEWSHYNPVRHYQNRLKHSDYLQLLNKNGFELLESIIGKNDPSDIIDYRKVKIDDRFKNYDESELLMRREQFIAKKIKENRRG